MGKCMFKFHRFSYRKYFMVIRIVVVVGEVNGQNINRTGYCNCDSQTCLSQSRIFPVK